MAFSKGIEKWLYCIENHYEKPYYIKIFLLTSGAQYWKYMILQSLKKLQYYTFYFGFVQAVCNYQLSLCHPGRVYYSHDNTMR